MTKDSTDSANNNSGDASANHTPPKATRAPRWMWFLLTASLALNLLIVGVAGGAAWKWRHGGHWGKHGFGGPMAKYVRTLPSERRAEIREVISEHFKNRRGQWKPVHAARDQVAESLKVEPFDRSGFEAAMTALREAEFSARKSMTPALAELAAKLTPEERLAFLKHQSRRHKWWRRRGEKRFGSDKDETGAPKPD